MWEVVEAEKLNVVACHNENRFGGWMEGRFEDWLNEVLLANK